MYTIIANLCKLALFFKVEQAMMHLGILSHHSSCMSKSSAASIPSCLVSRSENGASLTQVPWRPATVPCMGDILTTVKEGCH